MYLGSPTRIKTIVISALAGKTTIMKDVNNKPTSLSPKDAFVPTKIFEACCNEKKTGSIVKGLLNYYKTRSLFPFRLITLSKIVGHVSPS